MKTKLYSLIIGPALMAGVHQAAAQLPVITSFSRNGVLVCTNLQPSTVANVERSSSLFGPWQTNWAGLNAVTVSSNGSIAVNVASNGTIAASVPMFYRVLGVAYVASPQYVPLSLRSAPAAVNVPIRTGVPFPLGAIASLDHLRLESGDGSQEIPAQFDALATWPGGSLKDVLVQFVGNQGDAMTYRLAYGPAVTHASLPRNIAVSQTNGSTFVDAGLISFSINNQGVLNGLWRDQNGDGQFTASEQIINGGEIYLINAIDNLRYSAPTNAVVTLEDNGPLRAVIKVKGTFSNTNRVVHPLKFMVRYEACQGSDKVDMEMTVIDDRLESDVEHPSTNLPIALKGLGMRWNYVADGAAAYGFGGEAGVHQGTVSGEHYLLQTGQFHFVDGDDQNHTFAYTGVGSGGKAPGWLSLDTGSRHVSLMIRDFWQQFPMELNVNGSQLTAGLFAERSITGTADTNIIVQSSTTYQRPNTLYFLREGGAKTYKLRLAAYTNIPAVTVLSNLNAGFQRHELDLVASPAWYTASGVWGDIAVGGPGSSSAGWDGILLSNIYIPSFETTDGDATMYGWRDYGDRLHSGWANVENGCRIPAFYDDTHVGANNFFKQFLRTGEMRWFQLGDIATRHTMDIDVSHGPRQGYWNTGGQPQPAGELKCTAHDNIDHEMRNLHPGHSHVSGLSELYLLTGDKRAFDVLSEIGNWWKFIAPYMFQLPFNANRDYREAERDFAWPLYAMNEYVRVTGDSTYHRQVAGQLVNYLIQWWQTPLNHIGYNPTNGTVSNNVLGVNDASKGTGYWTMTLMDNNAGYNATGANPWMAGPLIGNLIKFYEQDKQFAAVGQASGISHTNLLEMLFQTQNYLVKYGYDATNKYFVYSEVIRSEDGGDHHILYGLAYLDRLFKQKQADGTLAHPEWYDTQPLWSGIVGTRYDELRTGIPDPGTQSYGFYGYEIVYPPDYFKIMRDVTGR